MFRACQNDERRFKTRAPAARLTVRVDKTREYPRVVPEFNQAIVRDLAMLNEAEVSERRLVPDRGDVSYESSLIDDCHSTEQCLVRGWRALRSIRR